MPKDINRGKGRNKKRSAEPFIMLGSEILNSPAYIALNYSAKAMLNEILHFHNGRNNGSIWISSKVLLERGFSKNTATTALKALRSHGLVYMTRRGGNLSGGCSWYAITWLPIKRIEGQNLDNFIPNAYRHWQQFEKKARSNFGAVQTQKMGFIAFPLVTH